MSWVLLSVENQRLYIKTETLCSKNLTEINNALDEVCYVHTIDPSIVSRWTTHFREVPILSILNDDLRLGQSKHQQMNKVRNLLRQTVLKKTIEWHAKKYHKLLRFQQHHLSIVCKMN